MGLQVVSNNLKGGSIADILCGDLLAADIIATNVERTENISMEEAIRKSRVLIEALPYIQSFKNKVVVIKFGGSAMSNIKTFRGILQDVVFMQTVGMRPIIVHGGGPYISEEMNKRDKKPLFVNGQRVTDEETLEIAIDVLVNQISSLIVDEINGRGANAVCAWHEGESLLKAKKYVFKNKGSSKEIDLGYVGKITGIDHKKFNTLFEEGSIPIVPPIAVGASGENYNINADNAASFIAHFLKAEKLVFVSNTHGILIDPSDPESFASTLHEEEVNRLIEQNVIKGGMLPKAQACISALTAGVGKAHIIDGNIPHSLLLEIFTDKGIGTQIIV